MFSWRNNAIKDYDRLIPSILEVRNQQTPRPNEMIKEIIISFLGKPGQTGILSNFQAQYKDYKPLEWATQLEKIIDHLTPSSKFFTQMDKISEGSDSRIIIPVQYLPNYVDTLHYDRNSIIKIRQAHNGLEVSPIDAFYLVFAHSIAFSSINEQNQDQYSNLVLDQFYGALSRKPLLVLLRRHLQYYKKFSDKSNMLKKLVVALRIHLVDELIIFWEQSKSKKALNMQSMNKNYQTPNNSYGIFSEKKSISLKYKLKVHHLYAVYITLKYCFDQLGPDFTKYCFAIAENYGDLKPNKGCLQAFIRLWIHGVMIKSQSIQNVVISKLKQNANPSVGWYHLKRFNPVNIITSQKLSQYQFDMIDLILNLIEREQYWQGRPSYLHTFACFFHLLQSSKIFVSQMSILSKNRETKGEPHIEKIGKIIVDKFNKKLPDILYKIRQNNNSEKFEQSNLAIKQYINVIQKYFEFYFRSKENPHSMRRSLAKLPPPQFTFRQVNEQDFKIVKDSQDLYSNDVIVGGIQYNNKDTMVSFYRSQRKQCWDIPIQYYQSYVLFYFWYSIAFCLTNLGMFLFNLVKRPKKGNKNKVHPINIRMLSEPKYSIGFILIIILFSICIL